MPSFIPQSGDFSKYYAGAMAMPDRGPNGTLVQAQNFGQATSVPEVYQGTYPRGSFSPESQDAVSERNIARVVEALQSQGVIGSSVDDNPMGAVYSGQNTGRGYADLGRSMGVVQGDGTPHASGTMVANKDQSRFEPLPGDVEAYQAAHAPQSSGVAAIVRALSPQASSPQQSGSRWGWGQMRAQPQMAWEPATSSGRPAFGGDAWGQSRVGAMEATQGMVTGSRPVTVDLGRSADAPAQVAALHAQLMAQQEQHNAPTLYSQSPAGRDPSIHAQLMAQQSPDQRGKAALDAAGTMKILGFQ